MCFVITHVLSLVVGGWQFVPFATIGTKWQMMEIFQSCLESASPGQLRKGPCYGIFTAPKQKHGCPKGAIGRAGELAV